MTPVNPLLLLGAGALLMMMGGKKSSSKTASGGMSSGQIVGPDASLLNPYDVMSNFLPNEYLPDNTFGIPFGAGNPSPLWPVNTLHSKNHVVSYKTLTGQTIGSSSRRFMAHRGGGRYHVGIDLYANNGDPVIACENGHVVNIYHFYHGSYAFIVQCDSGLVINYGEIAKNSWKEFGLTEGSRISRGQGIARIGKMSGGSSMLHFETYMPPTDTNKKYHGGTTGPILNPTYYLLLASYLTRDTGRSLSSTGANCAKQMYAKVPLGTDLSQFIDDETHDHEHPTDSVAAELILDKAEPGHYSDNRGDGP